MKRNRLLNLPNSVTIIKQWHIPKCQMPTRNMRKSSKPIECIQIVKLHEKMAHIQQQNGAILDTQISESEREKEKKKKMSEWIPSLSLKYLLFPHFAIFFNLIWFPVRAFLPNVFFFHSCNSFCCSSLLVIFFSIVLWGTGEKNGKHIGSFDAGLIAHFLVAFKQTTKVRFIVTAFFNMSHDFHWEKKRSFSCSLSLSLVLWFTVIAMNSLLCGKIVRIWKICSHIFINAHFQRTSALILLVEMQIIARKKNLHLNSGYLNKIRDGNWIQKKIKQTGFRCRLKFSSIATAEWRRQQIAASER